MKKTIIAASLAAAAPLCASAHDVSALDHAPIGVMGDHRHGQGEFMLSYRLMHMDMGGVQIGTDSVSPDTVATTVPNRFADAPGQPPTLRIVPLQMRMDMHMLGAMYGISDRITLMAMGSYVAKEMDHATYQGDMGTGRLGEFTTSPQGFADTKLAALIGLTETVHVNAGISVPTGSITKTDDILTPMGMQPTVRVPYAMQLGSGTWDLEPGITYRDQTPAFGWGAQVKGTIHLGTNDAGYRQGDRYMATAWLAYSLDQAIAVSARLQGETLGRVNGMDPNIAGPVQTANPDFQGGETLTGFVGVNSVFTHGALAGWRVGVEAGLPLVQDLNGPQMPDDWSLTVGVQKAF